MTRKSIAQAAIEELRAIKDRCAQYAEELRIANRHAGECRKEALDALQKLAAVEQANRLARDLLKQSEAERDRLARELAEARAKLDHERTDAMIAHRWFAERFGEVMNGRDFAVKCPIATEMLAEAQAKTAQRCAEIAARHAEEMDSCAEELWKRGIPATHHEAAGKSARRICQEIRREFALDAARGGKDASQKGAKS